MKTKSRSEVGGQRSEVRDPKFFFLTSDFRHLTSFVFLLLFSSCTFVVRFPAFEVKRHPSGKVFRGVFHVHSNLSHDSKASLEYIYKIAQKARLDFVAVTDHNNIDGADAYEKSGLPKDPLLIFGNEISSSNGHLIALGVHEIPPPDKESGQELIDWIHEKGGYAVIPHPLGRKNKSKWLDWNIKRFDGLEVYNFFYNIFDINLIEFGLEFAFLPPSIFLRVLDNNMTRYFELYDRVLQHDKVAAIGGTDAHVRFQWLGWTPENLLLSFQSVNTLVLADSLDSKKIIEALGKGKCFTAFEAFGDASDFKFQAEQGNRSYTMGDNLAADFRMNFTVKVPKPARIRLLRDGEVILEQEGMQVTHEDTRPGVYRAEVYQGKKLWIISSPIYSGR